MILVWTPVIAAVYVQVGLLAYRYSKTSNALNSALDWQRFDIDADNLWHIFYISSAVKMLSTLFACGGGTPLPPPRDLCLGGLRGGVCWG